MNEFDPFFEEMYNYIVDLESAVNGVRDHVDFRFKNRLVKVCLIGDKSVHVMRGDEPDILAFKATDQIHIQKIALAFRIRGFRQWEAKTLEEREALLVSLVVTDD